MSDTSQGPGWWLATDGRWYPPESHPNAAPLPPPPAPPRLPTPLSFQPLRASTAKWTQGAMWVVAGAQAVMALVGFYYWTAFDSWVNGNGSLDAAATAEDTFNAVSTISGVLWLGGFVFLVVWSAQVHTTTTSLLPGTKFRKYSRGWSIGVWFIPFANFISTPQVIAENQKIAFAPRSNGTVHDSWASTSVRSGLIWWWVLAVGGLLISQFGSENMTDVSISNSDYLTGITAVAVGSLISAAGVALGARVIMDMNARLTK